MYIDIETDLLGYASIRLLTTFRHQYRTRHPVTSAAVALGDLACAAGAAAAHAAALVDPAPMWIENAHRRLTGLRSV